MGVIKLQTDMGLTQILADPRDEISLAFWVFSFVREGNYRYGMPRGPLLIFQRKRLACLFLSDDWLPRISGATVRNDSFTLPGLEH